MKRARHDRVAALALAAVASTTVAGCAGDDDETQGSHESTATVSPTQGSIPAGDGPVEPGTHRIPRSAWSVTDFSVTFPEDWTVQHGHVFHANQDTNEEVDLYAVVVDALYADACVGDETGELLEVGRSVDDLAAALLRQPGPKASGPVETTLGGYPAIRIDLTVPEGLDLNACNLEGIGLQILYSPPADKYFVLLADGVASVYILEVDGQRQVFLTQHRTGTSDKDLVELQSVLDSIRIGT